MKVLFIGLARAIWLFDVSELNPKGKSLQTVIEGIAKQYKFAKSPQNLLDFGDKKGLNFAAGTFLNKAGVPVLVTFTIFTDGFVAETMSSTDDSTAFLIELTDWLSREHGLQVPQRIRKAFVSQIDFECDKSLAKLNPKLSEFLKSVESRVTSGDGKIRQFDVGGLNLWTEDVNQPSAPAVVRFERKIQAPFSANHYFSQAPVETEAHKLLLNEFELLLNS